MRVIWLVCLLAAPIAASEPASTAATLVVHVTQIKRVESDPDRPRADRLLVSLFDQEEGFPNGKDEAKDARILSVDGEEMDIQFEGLTPGVYAVAIIHDENGNGRVDLKKALFVPVGLAEGYGASNGAKAAFGPPKFRDAKFAVHAPRTDITISLEY